jgi:hypothetical protein
MKLPLLVLAFATGQQATALAVGAKIRAGLEKRQGNGIAGSLLSGKEILALILNKKGTSGFLREPAASKLTKDD